MTKRDVATIGCRLLAIYCLINALGMGGGLFQSVLSIITAMSGSGTTTVRMGSNNTSLWLIIIVAFVPSILQLSFGIFLWMFSDGVGAIVAGEERGALAVAAWDKHDFKSVALFIMGLYFLVASLPEAAYAAVSAYYLFSTPTTAPFAAFTVGGEWRMWSSIARAIAEMLCGMVLLISSHFMSRRGKAAEEENGQEAGNTG